MRVNLPHTRLLRLTRAGPCVRVGGIENKMNRVPYPRNGVGVMNFWDGLAQTPQWRHCPNVIRIVQLLGSADLLEEHGIDRRGSFLGKLGQVVAEVLVSRLTGAQPQAQDRSPNHNQYQRRQEHRFPTRTPALPGGDARHPAGWRLRLGGWLLLQCQQSYLSRTAVIFSHLSGAPPLDQSSKIGGCDDLGG